MVIDTSKVNKTYVIAGIVLLLLISLIGYWAWQKHADTEERLHQAIVLTEKQAQDANVLQNKLEMNKQNSEMLAAFIAKAQLGQVQPVTHFTVQAPSLPLATEQVADRINAKDPTLPPVALEKTDRTVVVPNANKTPQANYDVGVFKVNNYRNWEWGMGIGVHGGDKYLPIGLQRNFSKDQALEAEYHAKGKQTGYEVKYKIKTDKLFGIF